ncbi:MAG: hypothetical protein AAFP69_17380 [Planctomycetota bacterium]
MSRWDQFWFTPQRVGTMLWVRFGLSLIAFWYFASYWSSIEFWFGARGALSASSIGQFQEVVGGQGIANYRFSALYLIESSLLLKLYLIAGMLLAAFGAIDSLGMLRNILQRIDQRYAGYLSPVLSVLLWLWVACLVNRSASLLGGPVDLPLVFGLAYCSLFAGGEHKPAHWRSGLARRLMQSHLSLLLFATTAAMAAFSCWWEGNGAGFLAAPTTVRYLDMSGWIAAIDDGGLPVLFQNAWTLVLFVLPMLSVILHYTGTRFVVANRRLHPGVICIALWALTVGLFASQWMYATCICVVSMPMLDDVQTDDR